MTFGEIIAGKSYPLIEYRCLWTDENGIEQDMLAGSCMSKQIPASDKTSGEDSMLISLDGDTYSKNQTIDKFEEWVAPEDIYNEISVDGAIRKVKIVSKGDICLTVWYKTHFL